MNIDKIKNYNQKVLAVLGTVVALIAVVGLISIIIFTINEIGRTFRHNNQNNGILSDEKIEELQQENKRKQLGSQNCETPVFITFHNSRRFYWCSIILTVMYHIIHTFFNSYVNI